MKIIFTYSLLNKKSYGPSVDDQPNFVNRDTKQEGDVLFLKDPCPDSEDEVKKRWVKKRKPAKDINNIKEEMPKGSL
jgi:hypothetical protein